MFPLFPYLRLRFATPLSPAAVAERLSAATASGQPNGEAIYAGFVSAEGFRLKRIASGFNHFNPVIAGRITQQSPGAVVNVTMSLELSAMLFAAGWLIIVAVLGSRLFLSSLDGGDDPGGLILPPLMFVLGVAVPNIGFWLEALKARADLRQRLSALPDEAVAAKS